MSGECLVLPPHVIHETRERGNESPFSKYCLRHRPSLMAFSTVQFSSTYSASLVMFWLLCLWVLDPFLTLRPCDFLNSHWVLKEKPEAWAWLLPSSVVCVSRGRRHPYLSSSVLFVWQRYWVKNIVPLPISLPKKCWRNCWRRGNYFWFFIDYWIPTLVLCLYPFCGTKMLLVN